MCVGNGGACPIFYFFTFLHFLVDRKRVSANQLYILNLQDVPDTIMEKNGFATFWLRRNCKLKIAFAWQNLVFHFFLAKSKKVKISFSVILCSSKNAIQWYFYNKKPPNQSTRNFGGISTTLAGATSL